MNQWFIDNWQHLMGPLDALLDDARRNAATLPATEPEIDALIRRAEEERAAAEATLRAFAAERARLATTLDEVQRALAVAGVPLRGEIS